MHKMISQIKREVWENTGTFRTAHIVAFIMLSIGIVITCYAFSNINPDQFNVNAEESNKSFSWNGSGNNAHTSASADIKSATKFQVKTEKSNNPSVIFTEPKSIQKALTVITSLFSMLAIGLILQYANGALINDRKDNSILFFKSMPVSETQVVLTRLGMAIFGVSLAALVAMLCTWVVYVLAASGFGYFYADLSFFNLWGTINPITLYLIMALEIVLSGLWLLPLVAWIFLAGAWAKKNVIGTAFAPVLLFYIIEKWFFDSNYIAQILSNFIQGFDVIDITSSTNILMQIVAFFKRVELWVGIILSVIFVSTAIYLRNKRFEI